jgi:putative ABC transport system permease protein
VALGAPPSQVAALVVRQGAALTAMGGLAIGLALGYAFARTLTAQLFGVSADDATIFGTVLLVLGGVALFSTWLPARRAACVDPLIAMREQR